MPDGEAFEGAGLGAPAGAFAAVVTEFAGVETEATDAHEDVAVIHEQGDVVAGAGVTVALEITGGDGLVERPFGDPW